MKKLLVSVLVLSMVMGICACGNTQGTGKGTEDSEKPSVSTESTEQKPNTEENKVTEESSKTTYTVKVVDENGAPIANVLVQLCATTCFPTSTNAEGVATWELDEAEYKASFLNVDEPAAGYTYSTDAKDFYFESGSTELTIVLKAL